MRGFRFLALAFALALGACSTTAKGPEANEPVDGKADSFRSPTEHGFITFGERADAMLGEGEDFHAFDFELTGTADITITASSSDNPDLDTVMYLYRLGDSGWGSYIERDDDGGSGDLSAIEASLDVGTYRILLKGYNQEQSGAFGVLVDCAGAGCSQSMETLPPMGIFQFGGDLYYFPNETAAAMLALHADGAPAEFDGQYDFTIASEYGFVGDYSFGYFDAYTDASGAARIRFVNMDGDEVHDYGWSIDEFGWLVLDDGVMPAEMYQLNITLTAEDVIDCFLFDMEDSSFFEEGLSILEYNDVGATVNPSGGWDVDFGAGGYDADEAEITVETAGEFTVVEVQTNSRAFTIRVANEAPRRGEILATDAMNPDPVLLGRIVCASE